MAGIGLFEEQLRILSPHTFNALMNLVMAMADVVKNVNKKSFFGRDKGVTAYSEFLRTLKATVHAMVLDGVIKESASTEQLIVALEDKLRQFAMAFPNWRDAYGFAAMFLHEQRESAIATINRLRV